MKSDLFNDVRKESQKNKLRSYRTYKDSFGLEDYLDICNNANIRQEMSKFRLSSHKLKIETDRYCLPRIPPQDRICINCSQNVCEDEFHFVTECEKYTSLRKCFFQEVILSYPSFKDLDNNTKFIWLMSNKDPYIINKLGLLITNCTLIRNS